ncbi:hypothetical protein L1987_23259 [Smallanthus sonchifolius]|uniref:Uncharacterized protein n=1 Tax=Smallanthus sonchifolius TaxID=185202 RepID=A0ACB9III6_9ASTR|nr:hypothetical protein L1987_23259 [Smallanthus sonchifolius]
MTATTSNDTEKTTVEKPEKESHGLLKSQWGDNDNEVKNEHLLSIWDKALKFISRVPNWLPACGGESGSIRAKSCLRKPFTFGVFKPDAKVDHKCVVINWPMTNTIVVFRSITDFIYLMHMLVQFRLAFISSESRVAGAGDLVADPRKIALHYLSGFFLLDLIIVLPFPQKPPFTNHGLLVPLLEADVHCSGLTYSCPRSRCSPVMAYLSCPT